jgi:fatty-acyl-CoA synthase
MNGDAQLSIIHGIKLSEQPGLGALTIPGFLREVTERYADKEALVQRTPESVVRWSYRKLWDRSFEVARALKACGVGKDSRVGILMTNTPEFLATMFGASLAGGVAVALNTFSTGPELEFLLKASGVSILLFERSIAGKDFAATLTELEPAISTAKPGALQSQAFPFLNRLIVVDKAGATTGAIEPWDTFLKHAKKTPPELIEASAAQTKPADLAVIFFSSGTSGQPKGIMHAHRAVAVQWWRMAHLFSLKDDVRCWTANGFFWSGNFCMVIGNAFSSGGSIVLQSVFNPEESLDLMQAERVTYPIGSLHQWSRLESAPNWCNVDLSSLHYLDYRYPNRDQGTIATNWRMPLAYGATETLAINCATNGLKGEDLAADCYGQPLSGLTMKIVDPLTGAIVPRGERGEIAVKGVTLMMGYLGKTLEESFDDEGFYRTGDGGYIDVQGLLYFEGRLSDIIKTGGANVSPIEIDLAIRSHPNIKLTQTIGVPDKLLGEMVVSCVVPNEGASIDEDTLRAYLKDRLASFKIPRRVLVMQESEMALTGSNKVKAGALKEIAAKLLAGAD